MLQAGETHGVPAQGAGWRRRLQVLLLPRVQALLCAQRHAYAARALTHRHQALRMPGLRPDIQQVRPLIFLFIY